MRWKQPCARQGAVSRPGARAYAPPPLYHEESKRMAGVDILASAFSGANAAFLAEQYARWATDPASVDPSLSDLFGAMNAEARSVLEEATGASWAPRGPVTEAAPARR